MNAAFEYAGTELELFRDAHNWKRYLRAQIRPFLTPEQQQKFDAMKKAHEDMRKAMEEMHDAQKL